MPTILIFISYRTVAFVLLKSKGSNPVAPEVMTLKKSLPSPAEEDVAFIAKEFHVTELQSDSIKITLREHKKNRRRKREVDVYALTPKATYRFAQLNTDELGVCNFFSCQNIF